MHPATPAAMSAQRNRVMGTSATCPLTRSGPCARLGETIEKHYGAVRVLSRVRGPNDAAPPQDETRPGRAPAWVAAFCENFR